jgi:hypothetical protein
MARRADRIAFIASLAVTIFTLWDRPAQALLRRIDHVMI